MQPLWIEHEAEVIYRADEAQLMVNKHRGLNYLFTLNGDEDSVLDAATVGDPTRCLNHPEKDTLPNVEAEGKRCIIIIQSAISYPRDRDQC